MTTFGPEFWLLSEAAIKQIRPGFTTFLAVVVKRISTGVKRTTVLRGHFVQ